MPPRYAYWTILVDNAPTAFRAREADELLPTLNQLKRKNADVAMKWFARGRLWDSPEAERTAERQPRIVERRGSDWRPGGKHEDPRARFAKNKKKQRENEPERDPSRPDRPWTSKPPGTAPATAPAARRPWTDRPAPPKGAARPWTGGTAGGTARRPAGGSARGNRPWSSKPKPPRRG